MAEKIFSRILLSDSIKLHPIHISNNTSQTILSKLKEKLEGKCTRHGYIKTNSIEIIKIAPGRIDLVGLNGYSQYNVQFYADVCNPFVGSIIKAKVTNTNKFGILANAGVDNINVLEIIIAKNSVNIASEVDLEDINIDDDILVEILGKKFELYDTKISIIGRVIKDIDSVKKNKKKQPTQSQPTEPTIQNPSIIDPDELDDIVEVPDIDIDGEVDPEQDQDPDQDNEDNEIEDQELENEDQEAEDEDETKSKGGFFSDASEDYDLYNDEENDNDDSETLVSEDDY